MEIRERLRWLPVLLSAAVSFAVTALLLGGWLFSLRILCGLEAEGGILFLRTVLLALASAALSALPKIPRRIAAGVLVLAAALALWRWEPLLPGLRELLIRTAAPLFALLPDLPLSLPQADAAADLAPCFFFLAALMALLLGFFTRTRCWWGAGTVCFFPFLPAVLAGTLPSWPGFLAMLAGCLALLFTALYPPEDLRSMTWGRLTSLAMSVLLLLLLTIALPQDRYVYPQWAMDARNRLMDAAGQGLDAAMDWELPTDLPFGGDDSASAATAEEVDLTAVGPRSFTGRIMLRVEGTEEGRVYLRGSSSSVYTGTSWEPLPEEAYLELTEADIPIDAAQGFLYPQLSCGNATGSLTIQHAAATEALAYLPYQPTGEAVTAVLTPVRDAYLTRQTGQSRYTLSYLPDMLPRSSVQAEASEEATYRPFVYRYYLDVPEETAQVLAPLSARLSEMEVQVPEDLAEEYRYAVATALQTARLLGETAVYDLDTPAMAEGEDFVAHFLSEGRGYCVHFATAAALLLRMNGIPARYVSGYTADIIPGETAQVPDYAAHAWVEIYLDGYGWYPVEVTPGGGETGTELAGTEESLPSDENDPGSSTQTEIAPVPVQPWENDPASDEDAVSGSDAGTGDPGGNTAEESQPLALRWLLIPAGILLLTGLAWGGEKLARSRRRREEVRPDTNPSALAAYRRYRRLLALGAAEDEVLEELGRKAKFSQHTLTEEERQLCWQRLAAAAQETADTLPRWKRLAVALLVRY